MHDIDLVALYLRERISLVGCNIERIPYASIIWNLMYAQTYTRPNVSFLIRLLSMYQSGIRWTIGKL